MWASRPRKTLASCRVSNSWTAVADPRPPLRGSASASYLAFQGLAPRCYSHLRGPSAGHEGRLRPFAAAGGSRPGIHAG